MTSKAKQSSTGSSQVTTEVKVKAKRNRTPLTEERKAELRRLREIKKAADALAPVMPVIPVAPITPVKESKRSRKKQEVAVDSVENTPLIPTVNEDKPKSSRKRKSAIVNDGNTAKEIGEKPKSQKVATSSEVKNNLEITQNFMSQLISLLGNIVDQGGSISVASFNGPDWVTDDPDSATESMLSFINQTTSSAQQS